MSLKLTTQNSWKHYARYSRYHPDNTERAVDLTLPDEVQGPPPTQSFTQADKNHGAWGHSLGCERAYGPSETLGTVIKTSITPKVRAPSSPRLETSSPTTPLTWPASLALRPVDRSVRGRPRTRRPPSRRCAQRCTRRRGWSRSSRSSPTRAFDERTPARRAVPRARRATPSVSVCCAFAPASSSRLLYACCPAYDRRVARGPDPARARRHWVHVSLLATRICIQYA